jgi:hypothetical protein
MCFPKTWYSTDISKGVITQLNSNFLNQIRSNGPDFFNQWRAKISKSKKFEMAITNFVLLAVKELQIPVLKMNGLFSSYLENQLAYFIFKSLLHDPLDSSDINELPLLAIPANSVFCSIPLIETEILNKFINRFSQMKEKKIDFTQDISGIDKTLLNIKLEMELEIAIKRIQFQPLIKRIYDDFNAKMDAEKEHLENEIKSNI